MSRDHDIKVSRDFVDGVSSFNVTTMQSLGSIDLMELKIMAFVISVPIPIAIPIPRFQCRGLQMPVDVLQSKSCNIHWKTTVLGLFFKKLQAQRQPSMQVFFSEFAKLSRTAFFIERLWWLLL